MEILIKRAETEPEIRGKAFVAWAAWHQTYPGMIRQSYLNELTLQKFEKVAYTSPDPLLVAKDRSRVVGFVSYGHRDGEPPETGEVFALYVLLKYQGRGIGRRLLEAALAQLKDYEQIYLWTLKENRRAIRFYQKCGFEPDGAEKLNPRLEAAEIRMTYRRPARVTP